jgi:hypothetical protein
VAAVHAALETASAAAVDDASPATWPTRFPQQAPTGHGDCRDAVDLDSRSA